MATTKGSAIASPQIYGSDPVEQTFAKGVTDLDTGGIAYAMLNSARSHRADAQSSYMEALRESNMMASRLAQQELESEILKESIKTAAEQANAGIDPSTTRHGGLVYSNVNDPRTRAPSGASLDLKMAQAMKARADAAHVASGGGGGDKIEITQQVSPAGAPGEYTIKGKGVDPSKVLGAVRGASGSIASPAALNPDGSVTTTPQARAQVPPGVPGSTAGAGSQARTQGQAQREAEARARAEAQRLQQQLQRSP